MVYPENEPENPILTRKFKITENLMTILPHVKQPMNPDDKYYMQEIDFNVKYNQSQIINPYTNLFVHISQNNRTDNQCTELTPNYVKDNELVYNQEDCNIFNGANEYRHLDLTNLKNATDRVGGIEQTSKTFNVNVLPDERRSFKRYLQFSDINGRFIVKTNHGYDFNLESDYVNVKFTLPYHEPLDKGDLFIYGQLSDWKPKEEFRLNYNYDLKAYTAEAYLKQGYYNYNYLYVSDTAKGGDMTFIEGTHWDTENDYIIEIYYRDPSQFYDRLLVRHISNSRKD